MIRLIIFLFTAVAALRVAGEDNAFAKRERRGREVIARLETAARSGTPEERQHARLAIEEVQAALSNNLRSPVPAKVDVLALPFVHYRYATARVGLGDTPPTNLCGTTNSTSNALDPLPSTFWIRPTNIAAQNLMAGYGRVTLPRYDDRVWSYAGAKSGFGAHAGFAARIGSEQIKVKFGEIHSEPFTARIFVALGYNAEPTDYAPELKVRYDRRLITEFNLRRPLDTHVVVFGLLPAGRIRFQPKHDPFNVIERAVLRDGTVLDSQSFRSRLMTNGQFNNEFEALMDYVVTRPANVQPKNTHEHVIGPWDFGQLGHEHRRELRGAGLLAAWLGWYDSRFENTRLKVVEDDQRVTLKHYFADLGGGLGGSLGMLRQRPEDPNLFMGYFTEPQRRQGTHKMTIPFRIVGFQPVEPTPAFAEMTMDDARWMARLIAQLSPKQVESGLLASGYNAELAKTYTVKLLSRREKMLRDLNLTPSL